MKYTIAAVAMLAFVIAAVSVITPQAPAVKGSLKLNQIQTVKKEYPRQGSLLACNWFCEQASMPDQAALASIVIKD